MPQPTFTLRVGAFTSATVAALTLFTGIPNAQAQAPIVIKLSHVVTPDTPKGRAALRFKQLAEEGSHGQVKVEVYPNSQLYKDKEELEALQIGSVQMLAPSLSKFGPLGAKSFEMFDLPYIFQTEAQFQQLTQGKIGQDLLASLGSKGIKGLAYWSGGFHVFSANKPLRKPDDLKGLKMRIPSSKVLEASLRTMGALPQTMPFSEVYQALQSGVVDGTENILSSYTSQKYYEVQKFITLTQHTHTGYALIANKKFWDGLPPDVQAVLNKAVAQATEYEEQLVAQENKDALAALKANPKVQVIDLTPAEREVWRKKLLPVHQEMASRIGADLLKQVYQVTEAPK
ncbi:DctP family TRAP transporter solute-binding subunit [Roseateles koreensis]|uniref:DctP family TRAP transporter solute-binding subunit n=1 Tax=Roseateles koreensis TaxID=2987526 RepID=A0ABT5KR68_9BURK|nr:DctP family TRAP transporter solute-binding subunit [Roseateles koreensis]MDC8784945.1 DctP family TRAP transporter solute-binding subunit [Roseateles koreensis]